MRSYSLRYAVLSAKFDQLWFPAVFWVLFAIVAVLLRGSHQLTMSARAYLGFVVPLTAGILAGYAILDDPALELRFATPIRAWRTLLERLGFILAVQTICALAYQLFVGFVGANLSILGSWASIQLAWLIPCLTLMAIGCLAALADRKPTTGALAAGLIWLVELIGRGWFADSAWARYLLIFMGALMPDHPALRANQWSLLALSIAFLSMAWRLLRRQERYL